MPGNAPGLALAGCGNRPAGAANPTGVNGHDDFASPGLWVRLIGDYHATASNSDQGFHVSKCYGWTTVLAQAEAAAALLVSGAYIGRAYAGSATAAGSSGRA